MKLSDYAKKLGVTYRTAWNWYTDGKISNAIRAPSGSIIVLENVSDKDDYVVTYARVSSSENRNNLDAQSDRLQQFCIANGWIINENIKEIGSGVNDKRKKLQRLLNNEKTTKIVVEHKDRLTRFGFNYLETLLSRTGCKIVVINTSDDDKEDLMQDLVSIITSFTARYYGLRRGKRKTEHIIKELKNGNNTHE
ncbi:MAG: IS607 family transposase [Euryarchaeota archaeon]|nr:IS607 family transposase [Euryarchaeota archaeon]